MNSKLFTLTTLCIINLYATESLYAQSKVEWSQRSNPDRFEGIRAELKSSSIELLSAKAIYMMMPESQKVDTPAEKLYLKFYIPESDNDTIKTFITVREYGYHGYWMKPLNNDWSPGWQIFSWPKKDVLGELEPKIEIDNLDVIARVGDSEFSRLLIPIALTESLITNNELDRYEFVWVLPENADLIKFKCEWSRQEGSTTSAEDVWEPLRESIPAGSSVTISLNGSNLKQGWYTMHLSGLLVFPSFDDVLDEKYSFYHY